MSASEKGPIEKERALLDQDKLLLEADKVAERVLERDVAGITPLAENDNVDQWFSKVKTYLASTDVQAPSTALAIARRLVSPEVRRSLSEWAQLKPAVDELVKKRTLDSYAAALKLVLEKSVSLFDLCTQ